MKKKTVSVALLFFAAAFLIGAVFPAHAYAQEVYSGSGVTIDATNAAGGTVKVAYQDSSNRRIKVQIVKSSTYNYNLTPNGEFESYPLNMGSGQYTVTVYGNVTGSTYSAIFSTVLNVALSDEFAPYLMPSQFIDYDTTTKVVQKAEKLVHKCKTDTEKVNVIYAYVIDLLNYDKEKAATVKSGYVPNLDVIYASKKGICFDYASMLAAMLRSQGVPTKLVMGYVAPNSLYHAWNEVYTEESGWVKKVILFDGNQWVLMDPTFASYCDSSSKIMKFIADESNYRVKYTY
ncbi:MAG: transglutaminase-like domain-containing protein [Bacillota bacterium]